MHRVDDRLVLSATDLANFLNCRRKTALDYEAAYGLRERPTFADPILEVLRRRGDEHERRYVESERAAGRDVEDMRRPEGEKRDHAAALTATLDAMRRGVTRIVQAALASADGQWFGYADVLRRVEKPGRLGPNGAESAWSYEALDTKLALETRGATVLQLALYSEMLAEVQGVRPEYFYVVTPSAAGETKAPTPFNEERYRLNDYAAYFRLIKRGLLESLENLRNSDPRTKQGDPGPGTPNSALAVLPYPEPVTHCDICDWSADCRRQLRADDHLSFVANCSRLQREELKTHGIVTLQVLGRDGLPEPFRPSRGSRMTYERLQHQARLQLQAREQEGPPPFEVLPIDPDHKLGLCLLSEPSPGDVFLDLEGATFARDGGREYLFGLVTIRPDGAPVYESFQAFDDGEEQAAFEAVMDRLLAAFESNPEMHVYHYAPYEPAALKKLMGRYATRGPELDRLLRAERFVDLFGVVRHAIRAGIESYSIKNLEALYGFDRDVPLDQAGASRRLVENALDLGSPKMIEKDDFEVVRGYNKDDCVSTRRLRDWLEGLRARAIEGGADIPRPTLKPDEPDKARDLELRARELRAKLIDGLPPDPSAWTTEERARWLLAYTTDWHTREMKASWWEYYRLRDLPPEDQADEPMVVVGLEFLDRVGFKTNKKTGKPTGTVIDRYRYAPGQQMEIDEDDGLTLADETDWGTVVAVDRLERTIDVRKGPKTADRHEASAFSFFSVSTDIIQKSVQAFADDVIADGLVSGPRDCRRELLLSRPPVVAGSLEPAAGESTADVAVRVVPSLDRSVLAIQGPPGTGKTYTGGRMIYELVRAGRKVGVLANSHKVIRNLLKGVVKEALSKGQELRIAHKVTESMEEDDGIPEILKTKDALRQLRSGEIDVLGGVAWTWASEDAVGIVDVLFVDEAGQMSLANVLGSARAAGSIVLLGDQQQLDQPSKASHPEGVSVSALDHILGGGKTMPAGRGLFLGTTRRLSPAIAAFTSEVFYEGRLDTLPGLEHQRIAGLRALEPGALWVHPVAHAGNQSHSNEEVDVVVALVGQLLLPSSLWIDREGKAHRIEAKDILVVSPYNAQVSRIAERLPDIRVGTVDKFQGQEAPVVIYSMATSRPEDAPRGMEFLYSLNRLNVATSRAQCAVIVVANPALFEPACSTPRQILLANALCRYREMAGVPMGTGLGSPPVDS